MEDIDLLCCPVCLEALYVGYDSLGHLLLGCEECGGWTTLLPTMEPEEMEHHITHNWEEGES
jgi:uncharacterized protein YbaR (Trm112 family)